MKKKLDYVTNSSSTSFCVWGQNFDESFENLSDKAKKSIYDQYVRDAEKYNNGNYVSFEKYIEDPYNYDWKETLLYLFEEKGLICSYGPDSDYGLMVGKHPEKMSEDMTLREFKDSVRKIFEDIGIPGSVYFIEEGWYDG